MDHPRSKLPAVLAILFCIALLGGVGVLLWKTLPEKQQPQQAETIQTDSVFSSEQTAVEPEREAPYEGELPDQAEAAQPEQPDSEQPTEPAADPAAPDDAPVTDAQKTAQATLASMTEDEKLWQLFFVTPEAITNVNTATVAGEATKNALAQYPVGGIVYFAKNLEDRAQAAALLANTQSYAKIPLFLGVDEEGGTVSRIGANEALGGTKVADMRSFGQSADPAQVYAAGQTLAANLTGLGFNLDFAPDCDVVSGVDSVIGSRSFGSDPELRPEFKYAGFDSISSMRGREIGERAVLDGLPDLLFAGRPGPLPVDHRAGRERPVRHGHAPVLPERDRQRHARRSFLRHRDRHSAGQARLPERHHHRLAVHVLHHGPLFRRRGRRTGACRRVRHDPHAVRPAGRVRRGQAAVADGTLTQSRIDESVLRILTVKAEYGILQ